MKIIKKLAELIEDEIEGAEEYVDLALMHCHEHPELAQTFYELAQTELGHVEVLHSQVVKFIERHRKEHGAPPEAMLAVWEYVHEKHMQKVQKVRAHMAEYKGR